MWSFSLPRDIWPWVALKGQIVYNNVLTETKDCICMGDFNIDMSKQNPITEHICDIYDVTNVIDGPTCFMGHWDLIMAITE